jgi:hypothetical protein
MADHGKHKKKKKDVGTDVMKARAADCVNRQGTWKGSYCLNAKTPAKGMGAVKIQW